MGKRAGRLTILLGLLFLLSGCLSQAGEDLYALPKMPEDYVALQQAVDQVMGALGAEYATPSAGSNVQTIQLQDLDGDGERESAVTFFRVASVEKPLKIYIFRHNAATGAYETAWIIEGDGTGIYSVAFEDLGGTGEKELVVSWQISTKVHSLAAYSLQSSGDVVELMRSGYTKNAVADLDRDNDKEIVLLQLDTAENNSRAELYNYDGGLMVLTSAAPLSLDLTDIQAAKVGSLTDLAPALFVSSDFGESGGRITDILTVREGVLTNLTLDEATGRSGATVRYYKDFDDANGMDINNDGILELPVSELLPPVGESAAQMYLLHWNQYGPDGAAKRVCTTYHCYEDGWYLILPEDWLGQVTVARRESVSGAATTERAVSFYHWTEDAAESEEFLTIYRLTGANRAYRAAIDERFVLVESSDVIYAAKLRDTQWNSRMDSDELRLELFNRIRTSWSVES